MATVIPQRELRNDNARVLAAVAAGESFVITQHGRPIAELRPFVEQRRTFVPATELAALCREAPPIDAVAWRADLDSVLDGRLFPTGPEDDAA